MIPSMMPWFGHQLGEFGFTAGAVAADTIEFAAKMHIQMHKNKDMKIFKKGILKIHWKYHHIWR